VDADGPRTHFSTLLADADRPRIQYLRTRNSADSEFQDPHTTGVNGKRWGPRFHRESVPCRRPGHREVTAADGGPCTRHNEYECPAVHQPQLPPADDERDGSADVSQVGRCQTMQALVNHHCKLEKDTLTLTQTSHTCSPRIHYLRPTATFLDWQVKSKTSSDSDTISSKLQWSDHYNNMP